MIVLAVLVISSVILYTTEQKSAKAKKIGIIEINGSIDSFEYARLAERAKKDPEIKAVVLRINSPGGTVTGSFQTETSISKLSNVKPVIASLQETATSGAYLIASAADNIYAFEQTITAGLGVMAVWVSYEDYYENMGIDYFIWKTGEQKDQFAPWRKPTEKENANIQSLVEDFSAELFSRVENNRPKSEPFIPVIRDGSTIYGKKAIQLKLVDKIGDFDDAIKRAAEGVDLEPGEYKTIKLSNRY